MSVLSVARVQFSAMAEYFKGFFPGWSHSGHDSTVGEWMYLTVCSLHVPGHDSSVGEWMNLTVCPPCGLGHGSSVGERMYLTACPPCGLGHDSSVGEIMYLTVYPLHSPGHDSSVREWMYLTVCFLRDPGSILRRGSEFQEIVSWLITHTEEEMGAAELPPTHWKDTRNMKQYSDLCPQVPPRGKWSCMRL